jgi:D-beta-D-heptose 7-phosphate kinase/D-beta-D-heptose 1-phosphate adenosyltransferase
MKNSDPTKLRDIIQSFPDRKILILGDLMLDRYLWGQVDRISPEAPVPVVEVQKESMNLGGAGNVCGNLASLGASTLLVGVVGSDEAGKWIRDNLPDDRGIIQDRVRPTTIKTRIIAHHQQVVRVDQEKKESLSEEVQQKIQSICEQEDYEGIVISDYNKGLISRNLMSKILLYAQKEQIPVFVDPKVANFAYYSPVSLITPNHHEAESIVHLPCRSDQEVERAGQRILSQISTRYLILKRGEQGMSVFDTQGAVYHIPTIAKEVYDVTGAGDTVIATASLALLSGATIQEAALLANAAAGIVVGKLGTATVTVEELEKAIIP